MNDTLFPYKGMSPELGDNVFIAPTAALIGKVIIGENSSVWFNSVLRADINYIKIGKNSNVQDGSVFHVDTDLPCEIGDNVTIGHNVILHACTVKNNARIGMGAIILDGAVVEEGAQVGAGSVVPPGKKIKANSLFLGIPARKVRDNTEADRAHMEMNARAYVELAEKYIKDQEV